MPATFEAVAPIRNGHEAALESLLRKLGDSGVTPPPNVHFLRFAVIPQGRLLYAAAFDGTLEDHLHDLERLHPEIWPHCESYSGQLADYLRPRQIKPRATYIAYRHQTLATIRSAVAHRETLLAGQKARRLFALPPWHRRLAAWLKLAIGLTRALFLHHIHLIPAARDVLRTLRAGFLCNLFNFLTLNPRPKPPTTNISAVKPGPCQPADDSDWVANLKPQRALQRDREDSLRQNQMTLLMTINPKRVRRLKAVLEVIDLYSRTIAKPGSLVGISTIHFVRWALIDDDRRLLMASDYDGSWEAYIEEFAEMILSGLNALFGGAIGFPPEGAADVQALKKFLRCHQFQAQIFSSAYPDETVQTIQRSLELQRRYALDAAD